MHFYQVMHICRSRD